MVSFTTAVIVEILGSVATVDGDVVKRILPFVDSGLQSGVKGCLDQQVCFAKYCSSIGFVFSANVIFIKKFPVSRRVP